MEDATPERHKPPAWKQVVGMTVYLALCVGGYWILEGSNISKGLLETGLMFALGFGLVVPGWFLGPTSAAVGTFAGWVVLGVVAAYTLG